MAGSGVHAKKLLIDTKLSFSTTIDPSSSDEDLEDFESEFADVKNILDAYSVYSTVLTSAGSAYVTIEVQKIVLDEDEMASLIHKVLRQFWGFELEFTPLGSHDLTFTIQKAIELK